MSNPFAEIVWARTDGPAKSWLDRVWPSAEEAQASVRFRASFAGVTRRLRDINVTKDDIAILTDAGVIGAAGWLIDRVARVALLTQVLVAVPFEEHAAFVRQV
jgi:hypothetical protein